MNVLINRSQGCNVKMAKQIDATKKHYMNFVDVDPPSFPPELSSKFVSKSETNWLTMFYVTKCSHSNR